MSTNIREIYGNIPAVAYFKALIRKSHNFSSSEGDMTKKAVAYFKAFFRQCP